MGVQICVGSLQPVPCEWQVKHCWYWNATFSGALLGCAQVPGFDGADVPPPYDPPLLPPQLLPLELLPPQLAVR